MSAKRPTPDSVKDGNGVAGLAGRVQRTNIRTMTDPDLYPPDLAAFEAMAHRAVEALPEAFRARLGPLVVHVEDFATTDVLSEMGIEDPFELTGLYHGIALIHDSVTHPAPEPARVFLYRRPILDEWAARGNVGLFELIAHVMIHELGHHFGWSDEEMDRVLGE